MNSLKENIEILDLHVKVTGFCVVQTKLVKRLLQQRGHEVLQNYTVKHWSKNWTKLYQIYFKISYMICNAVKKIQISKAHWNLIIFLQLYTKLFFQMRLIYGNCKTTSIYVREIFTRFARASWWLFLATNNYSHMAVLTWMLVRLGHENLWNKVTANENFQYFFHQPCWLSTLQCMDTLYFP